MKRLELPLEVLDLFTGVGGFTLGFENAGMRTIGMCEIDPFCREWLAQHWPGMPIYPNVRGLNGRTVGYADVVAGGFPCQDISAAGKGAGLDGERSGLWFEMRRILREVRSTWVVAENVTALRIRGADVVLGDMETLGYTCWPFVVGADDIGAPQRRKRVWLVGRRMADADRDAIRLIEQRLSGRWPGGIRHSWEAESRRSDGEDLANADHAGREESRRQRAIREEHAAAERCGEVLADAKSGGLRTDGSASQRAGHADERGATVADSDRGRCEGVGLADGSGFESARRDIADGCGSARARDRRHGESPSVGDTAGVGAASRLPATPARHGERDQSAVTHDGSLRCRWPAPPGERQHEWEAERTVSNAECRLGVSVDGLPARMGPALNRARLKACGNSIVPHIAELIGRVIVGVEFELAQLRKP